MNPTPTTIAALRVVQRHKVTTPAQFANLMWPDSPAHKRHYKVGNSRGTAQGAALNRSAGAYLGKLKKWGLVSYHPLMGYFLTVTGCAVLAESDVEEKLL